MLPKLLPEDVDAPLGPLTVRVSMASLLVADARKCAEAAEYLEKFARQVADFLVFQPRKSVKVIAGLFLNIAWSQNTVGRVSAVPHNNR